MARPPDNTLPEGLPVIFTWSDARELGLTDARLARLETDGIIDRLDRGLYARSGAVTKDLALVFEKAGDVATLCLSSALARADLIDDIPSLIHVALPRGTHRPRTTLPVRWHSFDAGTFHLGRVPRVPDSGLEIATYSAERSICDAYRMRHTQGDLGPRALRAWARSSSAQPSTLLSIAHHFPKAEGAIRRDLEILL
jgi:hypothetical protein